ncbi:MAG: PTS lactose/cellobiose transporter subunit IIA [Lachnospiraceae bacterium]|nr:PTS lactose/cellobiose transporter subunit IIA [Lachnospiraceae bacterium]
MDAEKIIMELVVNGGDARSKALEAVALAAKQDFESAAEKMKECEASMYKAHHYQTELIQAEMRGEKTELSLIMVHGQDHLMNAMTVRDLALQMIEMYRVIYQR